MSIILYGLNASPKFLWKPFGASGGLGEEVTGPKQPGGKGGGESVHRGGGCAAWGPCSQGGVQPGGRAAWEGAMQRRGGACSLGESV